MKKTLIEQYDITIQKLGMNGNLISWSKSGYRNSHPDNICIFNSNVCTEDGKIWYGDIDVTKSEQKLKELAKELDQDIYVLYEMDARFDNEDKPLLSNYRVKFTNTGEMIENEKWS